jgi:hypothetical protein
VDSRPAFTEFVIAAAQGSAVADAGEQVTARILVVDDEPDLEVLIAPLAADRSAKGPSASRSPGTASAH